MSEQPLSTSEQSPGFPSQGVRTLITLLLFFHFFALAAGVAGNFGARSGLRMQLRASPGIQPYLQLLNMDTSYGYGLIDNTPSDFDHMCQIILDPPKDFSGDIRSIKPEQVIELLPDSIHNGMRRRRYLSLARRLSIYQNDSNEEANLVAALAGGMLRSAKIDSGAHQFRCLAQGTQEMGSIEDINPELRDPNHPDYFSTLYEADLILDAQRWSPSKRGGRGEMTQSRTGRGRSR